MITKKDNTYEKGNGFELMINLAKLKAEGNAPEVLEVSEEEFNSIKYFDVGTTNICGIPVRVRDDHAS